jgi:hypothetical protein
MNTAVRGHPGQRGITGALLSTGADDLDLERFDAIQDGRCRTPGK